MNQETKSFSEIYVDLENINETSFDQTIRQAVDLTFSKLGVKVKQTLYSSLEVDYKLSKEDIPNKIGEFVNALEKIFGTSALLLEIDVMKTIRQRIPEFKCAAKNPDLAFVDYLASLKNFMEVS